MTDGKYETWPPTEMSVARRRPWSVVADFHARAAATGIIIIIIIINKT